MAVEGLLGGRAQTLRGLKRGQGNRAQAPTRGQGGAAGAAVGRQAPPRAAPPSGGLRGLRTPPTPKQRLIQRRLVPKLRPPPKPQGTPGRKSNAQIAAETARSAPNPAAANRVVLAPPKGVRFHGGFRVPDFVKNVLIPSLTGNTFEQRFNRGAQDRATRAVLHAASTVPGKLLPKNAFGPKVGLGAKQAGFAGGLGNAAKDVVDLPGNIAETTYLTGHALGEAAQNRPQELKQLGKAFVKTDPWARLLQGDTKGFAKGFQQHPVGTLLEAGGVKSLVGRGLGTVARSGALGEGAKTAAATTERPPLRPLGAEGPVFKRGRYSRDVINKAIQRAGERQRAKHNLAQEPPRHPQQTYTEPTVTSVMRHPVAKTETNALLVDRANREAGVTNVRQRGARGEVTKQFDKGQRKVSDIQGAAESLVAARIIRHPQTVEQDLRTFLNRIQQPSARALYGNETALRDQNIASAKALLADRKFLANPQPVLDAAEHGFVTPQNQLEQQLLGQPTGLKPEHIPSKYVPYAVVHMGAKAAEGAIRTPEWERYQDAIRTEQETQKQLGKAQRRFDIAKAKPTTTRAALQQAKDKLADAKVTHANARADKLDARVPKTQRSFTPWLLDRHGEPLTVEQVKAHMLADKNGPVHEPAFFSQRDRELGGTNPYYRAPIRKGGAPKIFTAHRRTGAATEAGTFPLGKEPLRAQLAESAGALEATKGFWRQFEAAGVRLQGEPSRVWSAAQHAAAEFKQNVGVDVVPVRLGLLREVDEGIARHPSPQQIGLYSDRLRQAFDAPVDPNTSGREEIGLMSAAAKKAMLEHFAPSGALERVMGRAGGLYARNILGTSFKWPVTEGVEMATRNIVNGAGPMTYARGLMDMRRVARLDPEKAAEFRARMNVGIAHSTQATGRFHDSGPIVGPLKRAPVIKQIRAAVNFHLDNWARVTRAIERHNMYAALGVVARRNVNASLDSVGSMLKLSGKASDEFVHGLTDTPSQVELARQVEEILGRWGGTSASWRRFLGGFAPFAHWIRVGVRFVYWTLPAHHPIKTAVAAALANMTEEQRKQLGLYDPLGLDSSGKHLKGFEQGGINVGGQIFPVQRYQSYGMSSDPVGVAADTILPQFNQAFLLRQGIDWKGQALKNADGSKPSQGELAALILGSLGEGFIPEAPLIHRFVRQGGQPTAQDTLVTPSVRPGTKKPLSKSLLNIFLPEQRGYKPQFEEKGAGGSPGGGGFQFSPGGSGGSSGGSGGFQFTPGG